MSAVPDPPNLRKEVRLTGQDTVDLMRMSHELGLSEADVLRMAFRLLRKKFIAVGFVEDTGRTPE